MVALLLSALAGSANAQATAQAADTRPNIIVILTDDQSPYTLSAYGNTVCQTPNIDRLAASGMTLDSAYHMGSWSGAVCLPSRTMIMTGRTVWHIPTRGNGNPNATNPDLVPPDIAQHSMPAVFNAAGYDTFRTCKNGNSYENANRLFTTRRDATRRGAATETSSIWHGDQAITFLDEHAQRGGEVPFLMYFGFSHPHDTRDGTPELLERYGAYNAEQPPTVVNPNAPPLPIEYLPEHPFPNPHGHTRIRDEAQVSGVLTSRTEATIRNEQGREYACIDLIDQQIGRLLERLEAMGELDNTYILFTSDHGIAVGRHGLTGKQNLYEHTWRVPMIVTGPGIAPGTRAPGNVYLLDILATICDFAGVDAPDTNEGISFAPVALGQQQTVRDVLFGVYAGGSTPGIRSVRVGDWKLVQYDLFDGQTHETQLFNLAENPFELLEEHRDPAVIALTGNTPGPNQRNLADDPRYAQDRARLEAALLSEMQRLDDPYRLWYQPQ